MPGGCDEGSPACPSVGCIVGEGFMAKPPPCVAVKWLLGSRVAGSVFVQDGDREVGSQTGQSGTRKAANRPYHVFTRKESKNNRRKAKGTQYIDLVFVEVPIGMAFLPAPTKLRKTVGRQAPL